jgi:hypothetical protein
MNEELENELDDDLRLEYDFANMQGGVRGKYVERYREGTNLIAPDFKTMTVAELRAYAIEHPDDLDFLREMWLYWISRTGSTSSVIVSLPRAIVS